MNGRILRTFAVLNALLFCLLTVSGQEPKVASPESLNSLREHAAKGEASAQFNLGLMYAKGQGVTQDYAEAVRWYRKAADQGLPAKNLPLRPKFAIARNGIPPTGPSRTIKIGVRLSTEQERTLTTAGGQCKRWRANRIGKLAERYHSGTL